MMTILLYGQLGKQFGKVHRYAVKTPAEAVKALSATIKGFKQAFLDNEYYRVLRGGKEALNTKECFYPQSQKETIRIIPIVQGSGKDVFDVFIIAAAVHFGAPYLADAMGIGQTLAGANFIAGAQSFAMAMALGGVAQALFSPPQAQQAAAYEAPENRPNYTFNGPVNTTQQGNPVPVCYGQLIVGSQVISAGLYTEEA